MADPAHIIAFQGLPGAYSHMACSVVYPDHEVLPCPAFEDVFAAVHDGQAHLAMIPIDNSAAGRVADIHHLLPHSGLKIIGEYFQAIHHNLMAVPGATLETVREAHSHVQALSQCRDTLRGLGIDPVVMADTAGSARDIAELGDPSLAAVASKLAAETYGLEILKSDLQDHDHNTTRFLIMAREAEPQDLGADDLITAFVFRVRNVPAALFKALGGFATNSVNMTKLESYMVEGQFTATQFYAEVDGHPEDPALKLAFEELGFFTDHVEILGTFPAHPYRHEANKGV